LTALRQWITFKEVFPEVSVVLQAAGHGATGRGIPIEERLAMRRWPLIWVPVTMWLLSLWGSAGCSSSTSRPPVKLEETANLSQIARAYDLATERLGHPPADANQLKPFLAEVSGGDPDTVLVSPHDGQPYVIIWGVQFRKAPIQVMPPPILAYEQKGVAGKRYVLTTMGVLPMTDSDFAKATFLKP
jgi:hypothetical protein